MDQKLDYLISILYETALNSERWLEAMKLSCDYLGGAEAHLLILDKKTNIPIHNIFSGMSHDDEAVRQYIEHFYYIDPRQKAMNTLAVGDWLPCHHIFNQDFVNHNEFYQDFSLKQNIRFTMIGSIDDTPDHKTILKILRATDQQPFDKVEQIAAKRFGGHLQRTLRLQQYTQHLEAKVELGAMAIDALSLAMFIVDNRAKILHSNTAADNFLKEKESGLNSKFGFLFASHPAEKTQFMSLIVTATGRVAIGGAMFLHQSNKKQIFVTPLPPSSRFNKTWQTPLALVLALEAGKKLPQSQFLKQLYDLSPAELRIAIALLEGKSLEDYATSIGVTMNTVRTQLKNLFNKTGTHRQSELVALLSRFP